MNTTAAVRMVERLASGEGRELLDWLAERSVTDTRSLSLATRLRERYPADVVAAALTQHELRLAAEVKFSRAASMYFTRDGLEQASSEAISRHRTRRYAAAGAAADLCCGVGGDTVALGAEHPVTCVDVDPVHLRMAELNAHAYGVASGVVPMRANVRDIDVTSFDAAFVDPARRAGGRRLGPAATDPPLTWCLELAEQVPMAGVKAAPGIAPDVVPEGWEIEFIAMGRELKEAALWSPALATARRRATILPDGHTLTMSGAGGVPVRAPGRFLLDPNPAVTRAGAVEALAGLLGAWKIDDQIAFLSADHRMTTPFGRELVVLESLPWKERDVRTALRRSDIGTIDIRRRGLAGDVDQIRSRLKPRGARAAVVVMTRVAEQPWCLVCVEPVRS